MKSNPTFLAIAAIFAAGSTTALSRDGAPQPDRYHLFDPVPADQLREITGDRPDGTESPTTVDAGHFQIEMSILDYSRDRASGLDSEIYVAGSTNVRIGLLSALELQILFDTYTREEISTGSQTELTEGFSDFTLRPKFNLWGNDGSPTSLAIMPAVKVPTRTEFSNGKVEGALILPFGMDLNDRTGLGLMAEIDWIYDEAQDSYGTEFLHTAVLGYDLTETVGVYAEYIGITCSDEYQAFFSSGLTLAVTQNLVFDVGTIVGLNDAANDLQVFSGFTVRF